MEELSKFFNKRIKAQSRRTSASPIVLSTRIRLARNLSSFSFSSVYKQKEKIEISECCERVLESLTQLKGGLLLGMEELSELEKQVLVERHLISKELAGEGQGSGVFIDKNEHLAVMINEEDHLRIQYMTNGFQFRKVWNAINRCDNEISEQADYAFANPYGYLTSCPTNTGTGMRVSVMIHLPGLVSTNQMDKVVRAVNQLGMTVRGWLGEGSDASGSIFQISNQQTLGESEELIMQRLKSVFESIMEHENNARCKILETDRNKLLDKIGRSFGVLKNAHILNSAESMNLLSLMRLATDLSLFPDPTRSLVDRLFIEMQPGHVMMMAGQSECTSEARDVLRAQLIRESLKGVTSLASLD